MIDILSNLDRTLFILLNGELTHSSLDWLMPFVTNQENWYPVLIGLWVALLIWGGRHGRIAAVLLIVAVALADQLTCSVLKPLVGRIRPCNALPPAEVRLLVGASRAFSFPSAHAANSFAMATILSWRLPGAAVPAFFVAALVAYSRVYVGVHYPFDVVAGAVLGFAIGKVLTAIGAAVDRRWRRRAMATAGTGAREE
ncbi:MAG: phosphatase PAP2 family protein [Candidatus Eisenbacteria bacterium]